MLEKNNETILIIGATGTIGKYIFRDFKKEKIPIIGTYYKSKKKNLKKFNILKHDLDTFIGKKKISHIIFSVGREKKLDTIEKEYQIERNFILTALKKVVQCCLKKKICLIYFSSDAVFNGKKGDYKENSKTNPINKYGKIKLSCETYIKKNIKNMMILRFGKVIDDKKFNTNIFGTTLKQLKKNKCCKFANDEKFTLLDLNYLSKSIKYLININFRGIIHLKSISKTTRYEIAKFLKKEYKLKTIIYKAKINSIGLIAKRGLNLTLNTNKFDSLKTNYKKNNKNLNA